MNTGPALACVLFALAPVAAAGDIVRCAEPGASVPDADPAGIVVSFAPVDAPGRIVSGVEVDLVVDHPWVGDLRIVLTAPDGTEVVLLDRPGLPSVGFPGPHGCGGDDIDATFTDDADRDAETTCSTTQVPVLAGPLRPADALSGLHGLDPSGVWTLAVADLGATDTGVLVSACLRITTTPSCPADINGDGVLNFFDLSEYLSLFNAQDPAADLAEPFGVLNFFDLSAYLDLYNAGCP